MPMKDNFIPHRQYPEYLLFPFLNKILLKLYNAIIIIIIILLLLLLFEI
jgi:hypothetical protein